QGIYRVANEQSLSSYGARPPPATSRLNRKILLAIASICPLLPLLLSAGLQSGRETSSASPCPVVSWSALPGSPGSQERTLCANPPHKGRTWQTRKMAHH